MKSRSRSLFDKSLAAMLAAIEVYNKPDFFYREETFAILAINSWELLLKARILQLDRNRVKQSWLPMVSLLWRKGGRLVGFSNNCK